MARTYVTISPALVEYADAAAEYLEDDGYRVFIEPAGLYFPNSPTMLGKRGQVERVVEVATSVASVNTDEWVRYARARGKETYIAVVLPHGAAVAADALAVLREKGVGICQARVDGLDVIVEPRDVSADIGLPNLDKEKPKVRKELKPSFKKISDGAVVDGFKDACVCLEEAARKHLNEGLVSSRIKLVTTKGKARTLTPEQVEKLTLGQLGIAFSEIVAQTQVDDLVRRAIDSVLNDRNDANHRGARPVVVRRIKRNTPKHAFAILNALREIFR